MYNVLILRRKKVTHLNLINLVCRVALKSMVAEIENTCADLEVMCMKIDSQDAS